MTQSDNIFRKTFLLSLLFGGMFFSAYSQSDSKHTNDSTHTVEKTRCNGKVRIIKVFDSKSGKLKSKEKIKNGKRIYFIEYNKEGKIHRSINRKGKETIHKRGCDCPF